MKTLNEYTQDKQAELFHQTGAFFAFSNQQFEEARKEGERYVSLGAGLIVPMPNARALVDGMTRINADGIQADIAENGKAGIIRRELFNYECFYTGEIEDCVEALAGYGFSYDDILSEYQQLRCVEQ
jgi:hypothetical protein